MAQLHISEICDVDALMAAVTDGLVRVRRDPTNRLLLFNYTPEAQYSRAWTPEVLMSRGLITTNEEGPDGEPQPGYVVARCLPKFFNAGEPDAPAVPNAKFVVTDKLDGSLGIAYIHPETRQVQVATRGSFTSEQAKAATRWLADTHPEWRPEEGTTYMFEWIAPENRIVIEYGGRRELILLAILDNATGADRDLPGSWPGEVVTHFDGITEFNQVTAMAEEDKEGAEGFVVRFIGDGTQPDVRLKLKLANYVTLHRIITGTSARTLWELLLMEELDGKVDETTLGWAVRTDLERLSELRQMNLKEVRMQLPDELYDWADQVITGLQDQFNEKAERHLRVTEELRALNITERKELAGEIARRCSEEKELNAGLLFSMYFGGGRDWRAAIWRELRPEADAGLNPMASMLEEAV